MSSAYNKIRNSTGLELIGDYARIARCIDMHTGGEPLRVVMQGAPEIKANSILDYRRQMQNNFDHFRKQLMWEPRGHADMYGLILLPPERMDSDFGVLFLHNEGYSTMCGHATIAIAKLAVLMGWVKKREPVTEMKIDAPCGQLKAYVEINSGKINRIYFDNVPSFVQTPDAEIVLPDGQKINYDLAYGGAFYAYLNAEQINLKLIKENYSEIIRQGKIIKKTVKDSQQMQHPYEPDLNFLYGTIFIENSNEPGVHSKNVCVFADGEVDRCATGSGVSGRAAIHYFKKEIKKEEAIKIRSIVDSEMEVEVKEEINYGPFKAIVPRVYGDAWISGFNEFVLDREDIFQDGFFLR
ncbi:MAG: proline racemase family protein [Bacteroidota bacterium]